MLQDMPEIATWDTGQGWGCRLLHTKGTRIPLSLLVCFAEGQAS